MSNRFQVDLAGMVDLLSRHLYSGPQVYLRELIQNAVDAVTARAHVDPVAPQSIRITPGTDETGRNTLLITDTGIGLTAEEATELLATIGRSSKRDEAYGIGRDDFIGQFGIGLLAAFMVADSITVRSRSTKPGANSICWTGHSDGTFTINEDTSDELPVGTSVFLISKSDSSRWLAADTVIRLAQEYASLLPFDVSICVPVHGADPVWRRITSPELPWKADYPFRRDRDQALSAYCQEAFGFEPLAGIDLNLDVAGLSGTAFILPQAVTAGAGQHRVYVKQMLLGSKINRILPDWAYFVRAVLNVDALSPTASREDLHDNELLAEVREQLGLQIRDWIIDTVKAGGMSAEKFLLLHHLPLKSLAGKDNQVLEIVAQGIPYQTTSGDMTLANVVSTANEIVYASSPEDFRRLATVARAQNFLLVDAGYAYDHEVLKAVEQHFGWSVREASANDLNHALRDVSPTRFLQLQGAVARAEAVLADVDCGVEVKDFKPALTPAVLFIDAEAERRRDLQEEASREPNLWGGLLGAVSPTDDVRSRKLVLNNNSTVVLRLLAAPNAEVFDAGLRALYVNAVMLSGVPLSTAEAAMLTGSLDALLEAAL